MLREAGLVEVRAEAQRRIYTLRPQGLALLDVWLGRYRRLWSSPLDAIERHPGSTVPRSTSRHPKKKRHRS